MERIRRRRLFSSCEEYTVSNKCVSVGNVGTLSSTTSSEVSDIDGHVVGRKKKKVIFNRKNYGK
jgi:hypothetical protein